MTYSGCRTARRSPIASLKASIQWAERIMQRIDSLHKVTLQAIIESAELEPEMCLLPRSENRCCWGHTRRHSTPQRIFPLVRLADLAGLQESVPRLESRVAKNPQLAAEQSHRMRQGEEQ